MISISQKKFALASGLISVVIYLACFLSMIELGKDALLKLSNLLFHGMDFSNITRMDIPIRETLLGALGSFVFLGFTGYLLALIYNKLK